jgi:hypothetical protein
MGSELSSDPIADRIERHKAVDRIFHWVAAASFIALLATGLLPVVGVKFGWVTIHWIAESLRRCSPGASRAFADVAQVALHVDPLARPSR